MGTARDRRSWSDEQFRAAVAAERSWRGVARALGLRSTSTVRFRRYAAELSLDTSHFTGQRPWSDKDLRYAVSAGSSWSEVLRLLGVANNGEALVRVKGHAVRLGLDVADLKAPPKPPPGDVHASPPRPDMLRVAASAIAIAWFTLRGYPTALPSEPQVYDLLVTLADGIRRVQVKSSTRRTTSGTWLVGVGRRPYSLDKTAGHAPYDPDDLDYFFVIDGEGAIHLIPSCAVAGRTSISIRSYAEYRVEDASSLLMPNRYQQLAMRSA